MGPDTDRRLGRHIGLRLLPPRPRLYDTVVLLAHVDKLVTVKHIHFKLTHLVKHRQRIARCTAEREYELEPRSLRRTDSGYRRWLSPWRLLRESPHLLSPICAAD